jgi:TPP-dependent pyruvate/acetoin dehydrogenase alpha subunit
MEATVSLTAENISAMIEEQALTKEDLMTYLRQVMEIRAFENNISILLGKAVLGGASHLYAGQEATAVGAVGALHDDDLVTSTHRGHGHAHAHGDTAAKTPEAKQEHYNKMMAEVLGRSGGYCKGKGGSMHIADVDHGNLGATGIVGGNIPVAVGAALAQKLQDSDRVVLCFFGDGAANTGNFHEALNMASLWDLPVVFVAENNLYAMSVPWAKASKLPDIADRACAYGIPGRRGGRRYGCPGGAWRCRPSRRTRASRRRPYPYRGQMLPLVRSFSFRSACLPDPRRGGGVEEP